MHVHIRRPYLEKLDFEVLEHPYSPDRNSSNYHLFGPLKDALRGSRFATDEEVVHKRLHDQPFQEEKSSFS